jgi:hypothetical protein
LFNEFESAGNPTSKDTAAKALIEDIYSRQSELGMTITPEMKKDALLKPTKYVEELTKIGGAFDKTMSGMQSVNEKRLKQLTRDTGKSEAELELLAQELGVNLYDATVKYTDLAVRLGAAMVKTASQLNDALIDTMIGRGGKYTENIKAREAQNAIDMAAQGYRDKMLNPNATAAEKSVATDEFFVAFAEQNLALNKGNVFDAFEDSYNMFERGDAFQEGNVFEGMKGTQAEFEGKALTAGYREDIVSQLTSQLLGLAQKENISLDADSVEKQLAGMENSALLRFGRGFENENVNSVIGDGGEDGVNALLKWIGLDKTKLDFQTVDAGESGEAGALDQFTGDLTEVARKMGLDYAEFNRAITLYKTTTEAFFKGSAGGPDWWQKGLTWDGTTLKPDTATPRGGSIGDTTTSKLSQTMARHQAMDGQMTGKRTVTSSWRDHNLGSSNSDHVTGRAYDLVGQNLGKYATMVHSNGGFAEFHGNMAERHLHVVPGPTPGVGDTTVPAMNTKAISAGGSTSTGPGNYSITINGANQSPEAIANMVVAKLNDRERSYRER